MTIKQLRQNRIAALALAEAADARARATGATAEQITAARAEQATALDDVERLDGEIAAEQTRIDTEAATAAALDQRMGRLRQGNGPRTVPRNASPSATPRVENVRDRAQDDPNRGFRNHRDLFNAIMQAGLNPGATDERLAPLRAAAGSDEQGEYSNAYGNFLIPEGLAPGLLSVASEGDPTSGRTTQIPMSTPTVKINARTDKNHTTSVTGGLRFSRRAETQDGSSTRMEMEQVILHANPLMGVNFQTEELLQDSPISVIGLIEAGFREELPAFIFNEKLRGTGAGEMQGVLNAGNQSLIAITKEAGQAADSIVYDNVLKMRARCWGYNQAIWLANPDTFPQIAKLTLPVGTGGVAMWMQSATEDRPDMLLGRPIFFTEFAETLGDQGDLILGNWSQYLEGQLGGLQSAESIHVRFLANERCFRVSLRNDGRCWWRSPITPKKGSNTLSPFVTLAARA